MKLIRMTFALIVVFALVGMALVADSTATVGAKMTDAAQNWLNTLSPELKEKALFPVDSPERSNWHYIPMQDEERKPTRKGVALFEMNDAQRAATMELLKAGTSDSGYAQATTIMSLESILNELEKGGRNVRDPEWYFVTIYGEPSKTGRWAWRIEGHHLALNFMIENGEVVGTTPAFFGANPAEVKTGDNKGDRVLKASEDLALQLIKSLNDNQQALAHREEHFDDVKQEPTAGVGEAAGLPVSEMNQDQQATVLELMQTYANRLPPALAEMEMKRAKESGWDQIRFAYSGSTDFTKPHTYRIQGPTFVIEFLNVQADSLGNVANHIHSAWRRLPEDF